MHSDRNLHTRCLTAFHKANICHLLAESSMSRHAKTLNWEYVTLVSASVISTVLFQLN